MCVSLRLKVLVLGIVGLLIISVVFVLGTLILSGLMDILTLLSIIGESFNALSTFLSGMVPWIPWNLVFTMLALIIFIIAISSLFKRFSRDTCITEFENYHVTLILPDETGDKIAEAFFGRLSVPPAAGGGFEVFYDPFQVEHLDRLLGYLKRVYQETKEEKYLDSIHKIEKALGEQHPWHVSESIVWIM